MGMFDENLAEGMRATQDLMAKKNLSYDDARKEVLNDLPVADESEAIRLLAQLRQRLDSQRSLRDDAEAKICRHLDRINALKIMALEKGWNLK